MSRRWKCVAMGSVKLMALSAVAKHDRLAAGAAGANVWVLPVAPGITARRQHGEGKAAPAVSALVMRCLQGGDA